MHTTAIDILNQMISDAEISMYPEKGQLDMKEFNIFSCGKASLEIARNRILALPKSDDELIDFALWYHKDLTDSQRESNIWDLISFFRSLPPTQLPQ